MIVLGDQHLHRGDQPGRFTPSRADVEAQVDRGLDVAIELGQALRAAGWPAGGLVMRIL